MPVGTKGTIKGSFQTLKNPPKLIYLTKTKGMTSEEMENLDCRLLLGNTYHLAYQPGGDFLEKVGGLHKFMNWKYNILTDSGGF